MTVWKFAELHEGRTKQEDTQADPPEARYGRRFLAVSDDKTDDQDIVLAHSSCPQRGDYHPANPVARCINRRADPMPDSPFGWHVLCEYSTNWKPLEEEDDPTFFRAKIKLGTAFETVPMIRDAITGDPIVNAAGDPPDPPLSVEHALTTVNVTQNVIQRPVWLFSARNHVNEFAFTLDGIPIAAGSARLRSVEIADEFFHQDIKFYSVSVELLINDLGHTEELLNDGLNELYQSGKGSSATTSKRPILVKGEPVQSPVPLDADGHALLTPDEVAAHFVFLSWNKYRKLDFATLGLPA